MNTGIERRRDPRRRDPRASISFPVVLMTPQGAIKGKTINLSISGLGFLLFSEMPEIGDEFEITLKSSKDHEMPITCEKVWSGSIIIDESVCFGISVRFTKISPSDKDIIASLVAEYT